MNRYFFIVVIYLLITQLTAFGQVTVQGHIKDSDGLSVSQVWIGVPSHKKATISDSTGFYSITVYTDSPFVIQYKTLGFQVLEKHIEPSQEKILKIDVLLEPEVKMLQAVEVSQQVIRPEAAGITKIDPKKAKLLPSAFQEFNKVLVTLPGVVSNNELSSNYQVRGGNFDENLVYVNGMQIYRPFLARSGQQEGLSFVNPDMVKSIEFSAGGWEAKYGDKLSSNLSIQYKTPEEFAASATVGMLGGSAHVEGNSPNKRLTYIAGFRHKDSRYLLNTLNTQGQYQPRFSDFQSYLTYRLSPDNYTKPATKIGLLMSYGKNSYTVRPQSRTTTFGTFEQVLVLNIAFDGQEKMNYDIVQGGVQLEHWLTNSFQTNWSVSGLYTVERESYDVEGAYLLSKLDIDPKSSTFNEPIEAMGVGTNYKYARNALNANIFTVRQTNSWIINPQSTVEFGFNASFESVNDRIREYTFRDSADFVQMENAMRVETELNSYRLNAYAQYSLESGIHKLTAGTRTNFWNINHQWLFSPRIKYSIQPNWVNKWSFKTAIGVYQQAPFYRELRKSDGSLNKDLIAQTSYHFIVGADYIFTLWDRDFKLVTEAYYKHLKHVIPYDIDDVRIIYHAHNEAKAYAAGLDFRVNGEFIKGTESWLSIGLLTTKEDLFTDSKGFIRRPSDQRLNMAILFEDHIPADPTMRVQLNLVYGSGLAFGPPKALEFRSSFTGRSYKRVDIGMTKTFKRGKNLMDNLVVGVEILNLLGTSNPVSFTWIEDFNANLIAVPNELSQRFINVKISVDL